MKLKNLLFVSLLATAFVACSNEEDLGGNQPQEVVKGLPASVVLSTNATDAVARATGGDQITSLTVAFYNERGTQLMATGTLTSGEGEITLNEGDGLVANPSTGTTYKVLVLANMSGVTLPNTLNGACVLNANTTNFDSDIVPMSSAVTGIDVNLMPGANYIGYDALPDGAPEGAVLTNVQTPISLTRNVARISIESVVMDFTKATVGGVGYTSATASYEIKSIGILNAASSMGVLKSAGSTSWLSGWADYQESEENAYYLQTLSSPKEVSVSNDVKGSEVSLDNQFYVLANNDASHPLRMSIYGSYSLTQASLVGGGEVEANSMANCYYTFTINGGLPAANTVYTIKATIQGRGVSTIDPDDAEDVENIFVKVTPKGWDEATQEEEVGTEE